jgi:MFS family permease
MRNCEIFAEGDTLHHQALPQVFREPPIVVSASLATVGIAQSSTFILADRYLKRTLILIGALMGSVSSLLCVVSTG